MRIGKFLNYIITILSTLVVLFGTVFLYHLFTIERYSISFKYKGKNDFENNKLECDLSIKGCIITIPNITIDDKEFIGFNLSDDDTFAMYKAGDQVLLEDNMTLYAIAYKKNTVKIENTGIDYIESNTVSCNGYNNHSCKVKLPNFNKIGYSNLGYSTSKDTSSSSNFEYLPNEEYEVNGDITIYPKNEKYIGKVYNTYFYNIINNNVIEIEKNTSSSIVNNYKNRLEEIAKNASYLFTTVKINLLSEATFNKYWNPFTGDADSILGVTYSSLEAKNPPKSRAIDIKYSYSEYITRGYNKSQIDDGEYQTLLHEMAHSWDSYYPFAIKGIKPKNIDHSNKKEIKDGNYYTDYSIGIISNHKDVVDLYNKYKTQKTNRPISDYAYSSRSEFWAEAFSFYYLKYIVPTGKFAKVDYPEDIKKVVEKYICIAQNNYRNRKCY